MANPRLPNITEAEQELLYEKLNVYNQGKASYKEAGCYLVVLPREGHPDYSLWFYTPLLDRRCILFIEDLKPDIIQSLRIVTSELWYANRQILVTDYNEKRMSTHGDDLIAFGKYRGHFLYEILRIDPGYVNWIAFKYTPIIPKQERFVKMAQAYNCVYLDKMLKKEIPATSHQPFLRKERGQAVQSHPENNQSTGRRRPIQDLRHRDDSGLLRTPAPDGHRCERQPGQPDLCIRQSQPCIRTVALPGTCLPAGEVLHISSACIAATVESYGIQYTRLNYVKIGK